MENCANKISFQVYQNRELTFQADEGLTVFFGLNGTTQVFCRNTRYELMRTGILVINPFEIYQLSCPVDASVICLRITRELLHMCGWQDTKYCSCYEKAEDKGNPELIKIRKLYASAFQEFFEDNGTISFTSPVMQLITLLANNFMTDQTILMPKEATAQRLKRILDFIDKHWNEEISLADIAQTEYLSVSYLSRFFQKNLNINFSQYLKEIRLSHAAQMLMQSNDSITRISYDCGFRAPSVFIETFKQKYQQTPGQFRQIHQEMRKQRAAGFPETDLRRDVTALLAYVPEKPEITLSHQIQKIQVDCIDSVTKNSLNWKYILNIGYARNGLLAPVQEQIWQAQKEIGFTYVRFHGIFDEDMHVYYEDDKGNPQFHFTYINLLFDFLLSQKLIPYVELSFMPSALAREQTKIFDRPSIISGCIDLNKWHKLVCAVIQHLINRYGEEQVKKWRFTTISQSYVHLGCIEWEDYQALFKETYQVIKEVNSDLQFGGPGCFAELIQQKDGIPAFLHFTQENHCLPDFISIQCYPNVETHDPVFMDFTLSQQSTPAILSEDPDFLVHALDSLEALMESYHLNGREIFLEECTSTLWQRDLSSETCYKAAWLAKNICGCANRAVFGYWLLTDLLEERAILENVYHGGYGLITYNGIPKAGYQAMRLIGAMGNNKIASGNGWLLTKQAEEYQLLTYNYCHYSNIYRYRYKRLEKPEDAYTVFESGEILHLQFHLNSIPNGTYCMKRQEITREHGSSFDKWIEIGAPRYPNEQEIQYLKEISQPFYQVETIKVQNGLHFEVVLQPLETKLLRFHRISVST